MLLVHAEVGAAVGLKHVVLSKRPCIQQDLHPLPRRELAPGVLPRQALLSPPLESTPLGLLQRFSERALDLGKVDRGRRWRLRAQPSGRGSV